MPTIPTFSVMEWTAILSTSAGFCAAIFILLQLRHMDKHRDLEITMKLFEWAETDRLRKAFRWIEHEFKSQTHIDVESSEYAFEVLAFFEQMGFLEEKKFIDFSVINDRMGNDIIVIWKKLEPWIRRKRQEKEDATFGEHFEKLYGMTLARLNKRPRYYRLRVTKRLPRQQNALAPKTSPKPDKREAGK